MLVQFIQMTATYSNAVLVAVLPHVSDFAKKLDLPVITPVQPSHVKYFACDPKKGSVGGSVILTNGFQFWFEHGIVDSFTDSGCYYRRTTKSEDTPYFAYYGRLNMTKEEAIEMARDSIRKLGYDITDLYADGIPVVNQPQGKGTNVIPRFEIRWPRPDNTNSWAVSAVFEIDAQSKEIRSMELASRFIWRDDPQISEKPKELAPGKIPDFARGNSAAETAFNMLPPSKKRTPAQQEEAVAALLPEVSAYARRLGLNIPFPLTMKQVASHDAEDAGAEIEIGLTNGCYFLHGGGGKEYIMGYMSPYAFWMNGPVKKKAGHARDYWGQWKMSEEDAVALARETLKKLYPEKNLYLEDKPEVQKPVKIGTNEIPRYYIHWEHEVKRKIPGYDEEETGIDSMCSIEIDADKKCVKGINILNETDMPKPAPK